jgi:hypothetical protein
MECKNMAEMASCERFSKNERGDSLTLEFIRFVGKVDSEMIDEACIVAVQHNPQELAVPDLHIFVEEDDTT